MRTCHQQPAATRRRRPRGFTLLELLMALTITVIVVSVITVMVQSVAAGTAQQQDARRHMGRMQILRARLGNLLGESRCILDVSNPNSTTPYIVLWLDGSPNAAAPESVDTNNLCLVQCEPATGQLQVYQGGGLSGSQDTIYPANQKGWYGMAQAAISQNLLHQTVWSNHVTAMAATSTGSGSFGDITLTVSDSTGSQSGTISAAVRNFQVPQ